MQVELPPPITQLRARHVASMAGLFAAAAIEIPATRTAHDTSGTTADAMASKCDEKEQRCRQRGAPDQREPEEQIVARHGHPVNRASCAPAIVLADRCGQVGAHSLQL